MLIVKGEMLFHLGTEPTFVRFGAICTGAQSIDIQWKDQSDALLSYVLCHKE